MRSRYAGPRPIFRETETSRQSELIRRLSSQSWWALQSGDKA